MERMGLPVLATHVLRVVLLERDGVDLGIGVHLVLRVRGGGNQTGTLGTGCDAAQIAVKFVGRFCAGIAYLAGLHRAACLLAVRPVWMLFVHRTVLLSQFDGSARGKRGAVHP